MFTNTSARRAALRVGVGLTAAVAATVSLAGVAQAHIEFQPGTVEGGDFSVVALRVPNERDDANTTRLQLTLPEDQPLGSVRTTPIPGWSVKTATRKLDEPIDLFGQQLDRVVSKVTWTATDGGFEPGQYQDFSVSLGQLPESGELVFTALQTYSSGEKVNWNEVSADESAEPEHPAPTVSIGSAEAAETSGTGQASAADAQGSDTTASSAAAPNEDGSETLPIVLSGAALVVSLLTALLVWRRGRPVERVRAGSSPALEDTRI